MKKYHEHIFFQYPRCLREVNFHAQIISWNRIAWVLLILLWINCACAQNPKPVFQHLTTKNGLSHNGITSLFQDSKGFIWIGTSDGLNRYDGKNFKSFFHAEGDSNSLLSNNVLSLVEDKKGNVLVGCSEGVCMYMPKQNKFKKVFIPDNKNSKEKGVLKILFDGQRHLCVETRFELYMLDSAFQVLKVYNEELLGGSKINNAINYLIEDKQGNFWVDKFGFQNMINPENHIVYNKINNPGGKAIFESDHIGGIAFDSFGNLWAIKKGNTLVKYNSGGNSEMKIIKYPSISSIFENILITPDDRILLGSGGLGAFIYDAKTNESTNYFHRENDYQSLCNNVVSCMLQDNAGNLWIGTGEGLDVLPYKPCPLQAWDDLAGNKNGISQNVINGIKLFNHSLWIALWNKGLCRIDLTTGREEIVETGKTDLDKLVGDVMPYKNEIWFGKFRGLRKYDPATKNISDFKNISGYTTDFDSISFFNFFSDSHQHIWMSTEDANGIKRYNEKDDLFERFTQRDTGKHNFPFRHYSAITEDHEGRLWFGYNRSYGLVTYDYRTQEFSFVTQNDKPVFNHQVNCLLADGDFLWIGSNFGLCKMNLHTYKVNYYSRNEGLPNNLVSSMVKDNRGNLWIATDNGLVELEPESSTFFNVSEKFDLPGNEIMNCLFDSSNHRLYFTTRQTLMSFCTDSLKKKSTLVIPAVTDVNVMGNEKNFNLDSTIALNYDDKYFSFEFTAPYFPSSADNQYAYKLEGFDKDWIDCGNRQFASYTNIPHGSYIFHIKASVDRQHWYQLSHPVNILIQAPFYLKTWFVLMCIGAAVILCLFGVMIAARIKLQRVVLAQNIRNKIAGDLHDDIGSSLSRISFMSEIAKQKTKHDSSETETYFEQIGENARDIIENMGDIVWAVNPQNDTVESILTRMRKFSSSILEAKNIHLTFETSPGLEFRKLSMEQRRNLYLIFKEIINNIAKHAQSENVHVVLSEENEKIKLCIRDDGKGFDTAIIHPGNGLKNLRKRSGEINAELQLHSVIGKGSSFTVWVQHSAASGSKKRKS